MKLCKTSLALLVIQLAIVSSIAAKYFYQRATCPRVWTRTAAYDPELILRGRYLSLQLTVDGCSSTLPSVKQAEFPRNFDGVPHGTTFSVRSPETILFPARLEVKDNKLLVYRIPDSDATTAGQQVAAWPNGSCDSFRLADPVDFYIPEHANDPTALRSGQELWIEVTIPPKGPPRPLQLALKDNGVWKPLAFQ